MAGSPISKSYFLLSQTWLPTVQEVLQADWQDAWHSPQPPEFLVSCKEIRLAMTVDANKSLLKRGIQIDTKPIEELLTELKNLEDSYYSELLASEGVEASDQNVEIFRNTEVFLEDLKGFPARKALVRI